MHVKKQRIRKVRSKDIYLYLYLFVSLLIFSLLVFPAYADVELIGEEGYFIKAPDSDWTVTSDGRLKLSYNQLGRVVTLDSNIGSDFQNYGGYIYDLGLGIKYKDLYEGYIQFRSLGPANYNAPVIPMGKVHTAFGDVGDFVGIQMLPWLREWYVDGLLPTPFESYPLRIKGGLFRYGYGNGLAMAGQYEEYGLMLYHEGENLDWHLRFVVPDIENKMRVGPHRREEKKMGYKYNSKAYFYAADMEIKAVEGFEAQPYLGFLVDLTKANRRTSLYPARVDHEVLGTFGADLKLTFGDLELGFEAARNFGEAKSKDVQYPDLVHKGYFFYGDAAYTIDEKITPRARCIYMSGEKYTGDDINAGEIDRSSNHAFSVYSPANFNLSDGFYPPSIGPLAFTGYGDAQNYGILHPDTFGDPYLNTNKIMLNSGLDFQITEKFLFSIDYWYMRNLEAGVGTHWDPEQQASVPFTLPKDLGHEIDLYGEYVFNDHMTFYIWAGLFLPGSYFKQVRDDDDVLGVAPAPNYAGHDDNAWQIEVVFEFSY